MISVVALFVIGAVVSLILPMYLRTGPTAPEPIVVRPAWDPGTGPLVQGLRIEDGMPESLTWSPDATQLAWTTFDADRNLPAVWLVGVGKAGFSGLQRLDGEPEWIRQPSPSVVKARVQGDLIALRWAGGPLGGQTAGVVDLASLLGLVEPQSPVVVTRGNDTFLAVAARLPEATAAPTIHVFNVTSLLYPGQAPTSTARP